ncbi:MAG TPA: DUF433 domain-containing protein [Methylomirabilota bacterium]|nr:DUF433 domain-containing protein [Methylomirabilota bacterium]
MKNKRNREMPEIAPRISVDPGVRFGKPVITGTRVAIDTILGHLAAGDSIETLMAEYEITREDILAVLRYAAQVVSDEEVRAAP